MSAKAIYEAAGKELLNKFLEGASIKNKCAVIREDVNWPQLIQDHPWLQTEVIETFSFVPLHIMGTGFENSLVPLP